MVFESQRLELIAQNKKYQRKTGELEDRVRDLINELEEVKITKNQLNLQLDEMKSIYRAKLMDYMQNQKEDQKGAITAYNAREDLIRSYREKEEELLQKLDQERIRKNDAQVTLKATKNYARELKYLSEDWAPIGKPLPEVLTMPPPTKLEDDYMAQGNRGGYAEEETER